jgi:phosphate-selective porin OprO and OprP
MKTKLFAATALSATLLTLLPHPVLAGDADATLSQRIQKMEEEIALLKRQAEVHEEEQAKIAEKAASVELSRKGLKITSPDKHYELSLRGYFQLDNRQFLNDKANAGRDELIARRLRPILEAKAGDASFRLMPDFAGSSPRIFDAYAEYKLTDSFQFRFGKFKPPLGLERLQSAADLTFIERGQPTNLAPSRDFGFMLYGYPVQDVIEYQLGVFNGTTDLGNSDGDDDDKKDVFARVFTQPFYNSDTVALQGLGVGLAGSIGDREGSSTNTILSTYKTPGQQSFFKYRSDAYASGQHWRLYPQAYWYLSNFGLLAEYAISNQEVTRTTTHKSLKNTAWQVEANYVLTGEDVNFKGGVKPYDDFDISKGGLGAWEVVARVGQTDIDDDAFTFAADPTNAATKAQTYGVGLNWYINDSFKLATDYELTIFNGGAAGGKDRADENVILTRAQYRF